MNQLKCSQIHWNRKKNTENLQETLKGTICYFIHLRLWDLCRLFCIATVKQITILDHVYWTICHVHTVLGTRHLDTENIKVNVLIYRADKGNWTAVYKQERRKKKLNPKPKQIYLCRNTVQDKANSKLWLLELRFRLQDRKRKKKTHLHAL